MPVFWLVLILLALAVAGYFIGRIRAVNSVGGDSRVLHSLPVYYGASAAISVLVPAMGLLAIWLLAQPILVERSVSGMIPSSLIPDGANISFIHLLSDMAEAGLPFDLIATGTRVVRDEARHVEVCREMAEAMQAGAAPAWPPHRPGFPPAPAKASTLRSAG